MNERIEKIIHHPLTIPVAVGVVSFGTGMAAGYILARKTGRDGELYEIPTIDLHLTEEDLDDLQEEDDLLEEEDDRVPEFVKRKLEEGGGITIVEIEGEEFEAEDEEHLKVIGSPPEVTPVRRNAFADNGNDSEWSYEKEVEKRTEDAPYVLHKDEFYADEKNYSQMTLLYYAGDNIMVDEDEKPVYNHERVVGPMMFGHGSGDPNVFYVRNDALRAEYEILHDTGLYSVEVLGLDIEDNQRVRDLRHSHQPGKFRAE